MALLKQLQPIVAAHHGKIALYAVQLNTGKSVGINETEPVQTASDIKLAILYEAMVEVRAGKASWDEKITLKPGEAVGGSGMLHFFDAPMTLTLKDVLTMMVIVSDNTAIHLAIDRFGIGSGECADGRAMGLAQHPSCTRSVAEAGDRAQCRRTSRSLGWGRRRQREMAESHAPGSASASCIR